VLLRLFTRCCVLLGETSLNAQTFLNDSRFFGVLLKSRVTIMKGYSWFFVARANVSSYWTPRR